MLWQRLSGRNGHHHMHLFGRGHSHEHHHPHAHPHVHDGYHEHSHHSHDSHEHTEEKHTHHDHGGAEKNTWELFMLGISGGIIPCPVAIATLLAAIAAGKIAQGLSMTLFFSLGIGDGHDEYRG